MILGRRRQWQPQATSTLAWKIPWTEEPGRLQSMGSQSQIPLRDFTFTFHFHALEKEMASHSSILAWRIPGMGEPLGLLSMGSHRVRHDWSNLAAAAAAALYLGASQVALVVKNPPANAGDLRETWVQSLGWKDPLEEGMATHSRILALRIPWTEEPRGLQSTESQTSTTEATYMHTCKISSVKLSRVWLCDPMNRSTLDFPVYHQLPESTQTHVHRVSDAIQPSHPLLSPSPPAPNPSQHQSLFQWYLALFLVAFHSHELCW